jgi:TRAP-type mannitol/chloroaromatic compound transport system permease small subunit
MPGRAIAKRFTTTRSVDKRPFAAGVRAGIERFTDLTGRATSWLVLVIVVLMASNVLLRYLFSYGTVWAQELEWHLLAPLILFGISYALLHGEHVRVDVLYGNFPPRMKLYVDLLSSALSVAISVIIIWLSLKYVLQAYVIGEQSSDPGGLPYRWLLKALIPTGFLFLILQSVALMLATLDKLKALRK